MLLSPLLLTCCTLLYPAVARIREHALDAEVFTTLAEACHDMARKSQQAQQVRGASCIALQHVDGMLCLQRLHVQRLVARKLLFGRLLALYCAAPSCGSLVDPVSTVLPAPPHVALLPTHHTTGLLPQSQGLGPSDLVAALALRYAPSTAATELRHRPEAFRWVALGRDSRRHFRSCPGVNCMLGPMDAVAKVRGR